jgi:hypothetical protein
MRAALAAALVRVGCPDDVAGGVVDAYARIDDGTGVAADAPAVRAGFPPYGRGEAGGVRGRRG